MNSDFEQRCKHERRDSTRHDDAAFRVIDAFMCATDKELLLKWDDCGEKHSNLKKRLNKMDFKETERVLLRKLCSSKLKTQQQQHMVRLLEARCKAHDGLTATIGTVANEVERLDKDVQAIMIRNKSELEAALARQMGEVVEPEADQQTVLDIVLKCSNCSVTITFTGCLKRTCYTDFYEHVICCLDHTYRVSDQLRIALRKQFADCLLPSKKHEVLPNLPAELAVDCTSKNFTLMANFCSRFFFDCAPSQTAMRVCQMGLFPSEDFFQRAAEFERLCSVRGSQDDFFRDFWTVCANLFRVFGQAMVDIGRMVSANHDALVQNINLLAACDVVQSVKSVPQLDSFFKESMLAAKTKNRQTPSKLMILVHTLPVILSVRLFRDQEHKQQHYSDRHWRLLSSAFEHGYLFGEREQRLVITLEPGTWNASSYIPYFHRAEDERKSTEFVTSRESCARQRAAKRHSLPDFMDMMLAASGPCAARELCAFTTPLFWFPLEDQCDIQRLHYIDMSQLPYRLQLCK